MTVAGGVEHGERFLHDVVTPLVERLFCSSRTARYGPYELVDEGTELVEGLIYRYKVLDRTQNQLSLQIFYGLQGIAGQLWEQEVRALLRVGTVDHPALPRIAGGAYDEESKIAFVVTGTTEYDLSAPEAIPFLRNRPVDCIRQFWQLADALALLHGQGLIHRNILPSSIQIAFEDTESGRFRLQLSRFEMSALISNLVQPVYAEEGGRLREDRRGLLKRQQESFELVYCPPELLAGELETDRSDVYPLGVLAWQLFVTSLPDGLLERGQHESDHGWLDDLRSHMSAEMTRRGVPPRMQDLLRPMLRADPRTRFTSTEVVNYITRHYDALVAPYESQTITQPYLLATMPNEMGPTVYEWKWIDHDPADDVGRQELFDFLDYELRRGSLVYAPSGAEPFVRGGDPRRKRQAKYVLLGRQGAWFCTPYRRQTPFGGLGEAQEEILLIKYVADRRRVYRLERAPFRRRLPRLEIVAADAGDSALDKKRGGRPSWAALLEAVRIEEVREAWLDDFERGLDWFLEYQRVELEARMYPYVVEDDDQRHLRLRYDRGRDERRIDRHPTALFAAYDMSRRPDFGDFFSDVEEDQPSSLLQVNADEGERPDWRRRGEVIFERFLDRNLIQVRRTAGGGPVPRKGWLRPAEDYGSHIALRRQLGIRPELMESKSLLSQLNKPSTIAGFRHRWRGAGEDLRGGADVIIKDMLVSQPFYALHGPPGTGKTTVAAHAVKQYLCAEPSARILVSAQSNFALDNLAVRILKQLAETGRDLVAIRVSSASAEKRENVDERLVKLTLNERIPRLRDHIVATCKNRLERRVDPPAIREVIAGWKMAVETSQLELYDRIRRGANLVFATCATATKANVGAAGGFGLYDWVIVEEAAKAWTSELAIPLVRGVRWTLIGDHLQLRAHMAEQVEAFLLDLGESEDEDLKQHGESLGSYQKVFNLFGSLFDVQKPKAGKPTGMRSGALVVPLGRLARQFRMREPIARVVSRTFYADPEDPNGSGQLETDETTEKDSGVVTPKALAGQALVWLDTAMVRGCEDQKSKNFGEVKIVEKLVAQLNPNPACISPEGDEDPVAILTPYRDQITALMSRDFREGWGSRIWSIHEYQGREANVVVASLVRDQIRGSTPERNIGFLVSPEIVNVLMSRARRLLIVVGAFDHFRSSGVDFWKVLCDTVRSVGKVVGAADVVESLETRS